MLALEYLLQAGWQALAYLWQFPLNQFSVTHYVDGSVLVCCFHDEPTIIKQYSQKI